MTALLMLAIAFGERKNLDVLAKSRILKAFRQIPDQIRTVLSDRWTIQKIGEKLAEYEHCFFL